MATFYNQATLNIGNTSVSSNVTEGEITSRLAVTKTAATASYRRGSLVTYVVTLTNSGLTDTPSLTLIDNLGEYSPIGDCTGIVPLNYVEGSLLYYVNGTEEEPPTVTTDGALTVSGIVIPVGGNVTLIYTAEVNEFARLSLGSEITNTATVYGCDEVSDSATVTVSEQTDLSITKSLCPRTVGACGEITYTFIIVNNGNAPVVATDGLTVNDLFTPPLSDIEVTVNGSPIEEGTGYTYDAEMGEFATVSGALSVPAATYSRDPETCAITSTPGFTTLTVRGNI